MGDTSGEKCCGHDHVGGDELWLTVDELADMIADGVDAMFALPSDATRAERRSAMRSRLDERRQEQAAPVEASRRERIGQRFLGLLVGLQQGRGALQGA